jgi:proteic killer suppression protein
VQCSFANRRLQKECGSKRELQRSHGIACAKRLLTRFADLEAAENLEQMRRLPGKCHELDGDRVGQLALLLPDGKRLVIEPDIDPVPKRVDGGLDWTGVDAIRIVEISDYHD